MAISPSAPAIKIEGPVPALGELPAFKPGESVRIARRRPIGHYRVPLYLRGKTGMVEYAIQPVAVDNEQEGFGRNAGSRLHYYRIGFSMAEVWPDYAGQPADQLFIEVYETWIERAGT